jgi:hypothetical protein
MRAGYPNVWPFKMKHPNFTMKITAHQNYKWVDLLPCIMIDWGAGNVKIFAGWLYWYFEITFK